MANVQLDPGTCYEIRRMASQDSVPTDVIAEYFGIPESLVIRVILNSYS